MIMIIIVAMIMILFMFWYEWYCLVLSPDCANDMRHYLGTENTKFNGTNEFRETSVFRTHYVNRIQMKFYTMF